MDPFSSAFRRELRARAHPLHPVVSIGQHGLTPTVLREIGVALTAHELIKVRVGSDDREERKSLLARICAELDCGAVQQIGKLLVLWRPRPAIANATDERTPLRKGRAPRMASVAGAHFPARPAGGHPRRRRAGGPASTVAPGESARRKAPAGKAPLGVPRAALPRRRRAS
ncbi:MAG: YhbY family RNA-binding protein [Burkholderiales bacterium]